MLWNPAGIESGTSWSPVRYAPNWANEADWKFIACLLLEPAHENKDFMVIWAQLFKALLA